MWVPQTNRVPGGRAHQIPGGVVEAPRPLEPGLRLCPVDAPKVVDRVATADDEHPSVAQRRQLGAQLEVVVERLLRIDRQLDDRDVGSGNTWISSDQVPWSRPQTSVSRPTMVGLAISASCSANAGAPGAGYSTANNSSGNP